MKKLKTKTNKTRSCYKINYWVIFLIFSCAFLIMSEQARQGIVQGISICSGVIIPSLFPFLALLGFFVHSDLGELFGNKTKGLTQKLFKLSPASGSVIFLSLIGGYPIGAKMTTKLNEAGLISNEDSKRLLCFCVNAGPAFVVSAVGNFMLGSKKAGVMLFIALTISSLTIGIVLGLFSKKNKSYISKNTLNKRKQNSISEIFIQSVSDASAGIINICSWVLLFTCITSIITKLIFSSKINDIIIYITEVTSASQKAASIGNIVLLSAILGFGGLCVHMQILPDIKKSGIRFTSFFVSRIAHSILSSLFTYLLFKIFPYESIVLTCSDSYIIKPFLVSAPACAALLFLCAILILEVAPNKKTC